jgi:hypothetical protein
VLLAWPGSGANIVAGQSVGGWACPAILGKGSDDTMTATHLREMGSAEVNAFLTYLAVELKVSASTQNQALAALLFLYRELLERDLDLEGVVRARRR